MKPRVVLILLFLLAAVCPAQTLQSWDGSGNALLKGTYAFRNVLWIVGTNRGDLQEAIALYGSIDFDGNGNYKITCRFTDSAQGTGACSAAIPGIYRVASSGFVRLESPLLDLAPVDGMLVNGTLVLSSTELGVNDLFIATQIRTDPATVGTLNGKYWMGGIDFPDGTVPTVRDSLFNMTFDGAGGVNAASILGSIGNSSTAITQNISARYSFTNGIGTLALGGTLSNSNLIAGSKEFYVSQDGSLFFGGSTTAFDMIIGIRAFDGTPTQTQLNGFYFQAGVTQDETTLTAAGYADLTTYYSSFIANGSLLVGHQRLYSGFGDTAFDYSYATQYTLNDDGSYDDNKNVFRYVVGSGGALQLGVGKGPVLGLNLALKPNYSGSGPFINPGLILNAASFVPSTAGVSRGELVTIFGTNLASTTLVDPKFPATLGNVIVLINSKSAPIYDVGPNRITVQIPYSITESVATIQVISNGQVSNSVPLFVRLTTPAAFFDLATGRVIATHADFSLITPQKPAKPGETIITYLTGLGDVAPALAAGTPAPSDPLSTTTSTIAVYIGAKTATTSYIGLAPGFIGLYQINVQVPPDSPTGDLNFEIGTFNAISSSAVLPVAP